MLVHYFAAPGVPMCRSRAPVQESTSQKCEPISKYQRRGGDLITHDTDDRRMKILGVGGLEPGFVLFWEEEEER